MYRAVRFPVEDEICAVVNQCGVGPASGARKRQDGERIHAQCNIRLLLGAVHIVIRRTIDDDIGLRRRDSIVDGSRVRDVEFSMVERMHIRTMELAHYGGAQQAPRAGDEHTHQLRTASANAATTAARCPAESSP